MVAEPNTSHWTHLESARATLRTMMTTEPVSPTRLACRLGLMGPAELRAFLANDPPPPHIAARVYRYLEVPINAWDEHVATLSTLSLVPDGEPEPDADPLPEPTPIRPDASGVPAGFRPVPKTQGGQVPSEFPTLTISAGFVLLIDKASRELLGNPARVRVLLNDNTRQLLITPATVDDKEHAYSLQNTGRVAATTVCRDVIAWDWTHGTRIAGVAAYGGILYGEAVGNGD